MRCFFFFLVLAFSPCVLSEFYKRLGVSRSSTIVQIKKAYRSKAKVLHPDRNTDPSAAQDFKELTEAYECLADVGKRKRYDDHGPDGCKDGAEHAHEHPFASFFGSMFAGQPREEGVKRGGDVVMDLSVTLEEIYTGNFIEVIRSKSVKKPASGTRECNCRMEMKTQYVGPGRYQMTQQRICDQCSNYKFDIEELTLEVEVEIGMPDGHVYPFVAEGEPHVDGENGDVKFIIKQAEHPVFHRRNDDLYTNLSISLTDALTGFFYELKHLDGHKVKIERKQITWPGSILRLPKEGMPNYENNNVFGSLFVTFDVIFPRNHELSADEKEAVRKIFGSTIPSKPLQGTPLVPPSGLAEGIAGPVTYNGFINLGVQRHLSSLIR